MLIEGIIRVAWKRLRGKDIKLPASLSAWTVLAHMAQKGFVPFCRGLLLRPFLAQSAGALFVGRGCQILDSKSLRVGRNFFLGSFAYIDCLSSGGITIGDNVTLREGCWAQLTSRYDVPGESIVIGDNVYIGPHAILGAAATISIGDRCQIGARVSLVAENHLFEGDAEIFDQGVSRKGISIGRDVWIGNHVIILDGVTVGDGAVIGAGTIVTKSVPDRSVVVGVPGKVIRTR